MKRLVIAAQRLAVTVSLLLFSQPASVGAQPQEPPGEIDIVVIEGQGAINGLSQRAGRNPTVRVEDEHHSPIAGAAVVFALPTEGATGEFSRGSKILTVLTNDRGVATAAGLRVNKTAGELVIHVSASYRGLTAKTTLTQFIMASPRQPSRGGHGKLLAILAAVGAAAAGGALAARTGASGSSGGSGSGTSGPSAIGITPGSGSIATPPH